MLWEKDSGMNSDTCPRCGQCCEDALHRLSRRERDVLRLLSTGQRCKEIAHALGISEKTVWTHFSNMYRKLGVANPYALVAYAVKAHLDEPITDAP
jgi:DNA-binding NarL/FixJ family response regulator